MVLIEAISVIINQSVIEDRYPGGIQGFKRDAPNNTYCADDHLVRIGFMTPVDVGDFCKHLEDYGFVYHVDGVSQDFIVVDQQTGPMVSCEWLFFGNAFLEDEKIRKIVFAAVPEEINGPFVGPQEFAEPKGWKWEGSLSQTFAYVPTEHVDKSMTYLGHDNGLDVYFNHLSEKVNYVGRAGKRINAYGTVVKTLN